MPNPLTGDFEAVLQVSSGTINRLLASMHQNAAGNPDTPSFPHSIQLRIGDDHPVDGVRGTVKAQIAAPQVELIDGATDRFWLEVAVRARYVPDAGTTPLPAFMNGAIRAQYLVEDIDPRCYGWAQKASKYLWVRVVKDSVAFRGTSAEDEGPLGLGVLVGGGVAEDPATTAARITRQVATLLATRFEATPHQVSKRFRRGSLRSLAPSLGDAAAVSPIPVNGDPVGDIASVGSVFLKTADFAIAMNTGVILGLAEPALASIGSFHPTVKIHVSTPWWSPIPDIDTVYRVSVDPPAVEWQPHGSFAVIKIKLSGSAKTDSVLPNATFDVDQDITLNFDGGSERLSLGVGSRKVTAHGSGPFGGTIEDTVQKGVDAAVKPIVEAACRDAQPDLDAMIARKQELITQLRTIDALANARIDSAAFVTEGMILRGHISLSPRHRPEVIFEQTAEQDGFTAVRSWIPGGRIDSFAWTWSWFTGQDPGSATFKDRFVLRRPRGSVGKWGQLIGLSKPLPGIDGWGKVCLQIRGVYVDPVTAELQAVSGSYCHRFGISVSTKLRPGLGIYVLDVPELRQPVPSPHPGPPLLVGPAVVDLNGTGAHIPANTLVLYAGETPGAQTAAELRRGLQDVRRTDAGLALLILVPEGHLDQLRSGPLLELERLGQAIGLATIGGEDGGGRWAKAFELRPDGEAWRLIDPAGSVTWRHDGRLVGDLLTRALDERLVTSAVPRPQGLSPVIEVGVRVGAELFRPIGAESSHCPPFPMGRAGLDTVVTFVKAGSRASEAYLRDLVARQQQAGDAAPAIMVVVDGADGQEANAYQQQLGLDFVPLADPERAITNSFGVRVWPTTFTLDSAGTVSGFEMGLPTSAAYRGSEAGAAYGGSEASAD